MDRVEIPTEYIVLRGLARGMVVGWGLLVGSVEERKNPENGKGRSGNVYQHKVYRRKSYPAGVVCSCCSRRGYSYFQYKNKVERGVELKFSQLGASRGRGGRRRIF